MKMPLRLEWGGGQYILLSCACFLITQPFLNICRHAIYQIEKEIKKKIFLTFIFRTQISH